MGKNQCFPFLMDYRNKILTEYSKQAMIDIAREIGDDPQEFAKLMALYTEGNYRLTQRSAWAVREVGDKSPRLLKPYIGKLISMLKEEGNHDAVARNNLSLMSAWDIPEEYWDELYEICFEILESPQRAIAIRVHAMQILANIASKLPDLIPELKLVIEAHLPNGSRGFQSRGRKLLKQLAKIKPGEMR